jgi:hypothetical protein
MKNLNDLIVNGSGVDLDGAEEIIEFYLYQILLPFGMEYGL